MDYVKQKGLSENVFKIFIFKLFQLNSYSEKQQSPSLQTFPKIGFVSEGPFLIKFSRLRKVRVIKAISHTIHLHVYQSHAFEIYNYSLSTEALIGKLKAFRIPATCMNS